MYARALDPALHLIPCYSLKRTSGFIKNKFINLLLLRMTPILSKGEYFEKKFHIIVWILKTNHQAG